LFDIEPAWRAPSAMIKGEKQEEREEKKKDYYLSERSFGSFQRTLQVVVPENPIRSIRGTR
jgi:HSP20 family protein